MIKNKLFSFLFVLILVITFSSADSFSPNVQITNPSLNSLYSSSDVATYWPGLANSVEQDNCQAGTDFLVMIPPAGCSPSVVRSDLLEEQNVPVFCKLEAVNVNPLIDVDAIKSISYKGQYPDNVASVSYYPARAAVKSREVLLNSPVANNVGYVVIVLKKQANESAMPKWVAGNLTATISYDAKNAFGVGQAEFYLKSVNDEEWQNDYVENSFWGGKGYLRLMDVNGENARIVMYTDKDSPYREISLKEGQTSEKIYFPGFYCQAGMRIKLNSIVSDQDSALLDINGDSVWVRQGTSFLGGACRVSKLSMGYGGTGTISLSCNSKTVSLNLAGKNTATIGGTEYALGQKVREYADRNLYVGYIGATEKSLWKDGVKIEANTGIVVLINESSKSLAVDDAKLTKINDAITNFFYGKTSELTRTDFESTIKTVASANGVAILYIGGDNSYDGLVLSGISGAVTTSKLAEEKTAEVREYFGKLDSTQNDLTNLYPQEGNPIYGAMAIDGEVKLLDMMKGVGLGDSGKVADLKDKFSKLYSGSTSSVSVKRSAAFDYSNSFASVYANNEYNQISLIGFRAVDKSTKSAEFFVGAGSQTVHEGDNISATSDVKGDYFLITKIERNYVDVAYYKNVTTVRESKFVYQNTFTLKDGIVQEVNIKSGDSVGQYSISISDITIAEVASISLLPELKTASEANLTYKIGIEKRAIKLSPEKANETAQKLNETIKKWEDANAKLGKLVESWKGACLVTSGVLQIKTLFGGFTGTSTARQNVMGVYKDICKSNATYADKTSTECYAAQSSAIDKDVQAYKDAITKVNSDLGGLSIDGWRAKSENQNQPIGIYNDVSVNSSDLNSWDEIRAYSLNKYIVSPPASASLKAKVKQDLDTKMLFVANNKRISSAPGNDIKDSGSIDVFTNSKQVGWTGMTAKKVKELGKNNLEEKGIPNETAVQFVEDNAYLLILTSTGVNKRVADIYSVSKPQNTDVVIYEKIEKPKSTEDTSGKITFKQYDEIDSLRFLSGGLGSCRNTYANTGQLQVEFYESGTNKGYPAKVPFDKIEGWYVKVSSSTGGVISDSVKSYQESGAVSYFSICNIGENKLEGSDDQCTGFNFNNAVGDINTIAGCSVTATERDNLIRDAKLAVQQAQQNFGKKEFVIAVGGRQPITVKGTEAVSDLGYECEDFMSTDDCHILYNVCDPVICPPSRCDFGGKFKVANVIQSGILGSVLLCLPNFGYPSEGGVAVPVCLTGIHAGIEGWVSILKSSQKCLSEAAATGKHAGICDEITSVYKCEFFWKQVSPLVQTLVPTLAEGVYNFANGIDSKERGGGEYMTFQQSWDNMEGSINYFKNTYASTSFSAFKFGNVEEIGVEACRNFIGTSVPTSASALDKLLKPESPFQFYAQFSEISLTDATVPATSQYKVYYHIYAGTDQGASYQVYLKDPPATGYVYTSNTIAVASGYIAAGDEVDETPDISAPAGYKQLCVIINNQEECGFKSVTTDAGLNMLHDSYAKNQASENNITTEKACSQGTSSSLSLANLNLQAGVEETVNPDITLRGIVRICSTTNPGRGTNDTNWKNVGYCGDKNLKCWLDQSSMNEGALEVLKYTNSISDANKLLAGTKVLDRTAGTSELQLLETRRDAVVTSFGSDKSLTDAKKLEINKLVDDMNNVSFVDNKQSANLLYLKFGLYEKIIEHLVGLSNGAVVPVNNKAVNPLPSAPVAATASANTPATTMVAVSGFSLDESSFVISLDGSVLRSSDNKIYAVNNGGSAIIKRAENAQNGDIVATVSPLEGVIKITANTPEDRNILAGIENYKLQNLKFVAK